MKKKIMFDERWVFVRSLYGNMSVDKIERRALVFWWCTSAGPFNKGYCKARDKAFDRMKRP